MLKYLAEGEVRYIMFPVEDLVTALRTAGREDLTLDTLTEFIEACDADALRTLMHSGCDNMFTCLQRAKETVYVPPGWIMAEMVVGGVLVYGVRKSLAPRLKPSADQYACLVQMHEASKKQVGKMKECLEIMTPDE